MDAGRGVNLIGPSSTFSEFLFLCAAFLSSFVHLTHSSLLTTGHIPSTLWNLNTLTEQYHRLIDGTSYRHQFAVNITTTCDRSKSSVFALSLQAPGKSQTDITISDCLVPSSFELSISNFQNCPLSSGSSCSRILAAVLRLGSTCDSV